MKSLKAIKNSYSILTICLILVGAVLLIWPHMALGAICKMDLESPPLYSDLSW